MKLYISDLSIGMLLALYLPFVLWLLWKVARSTGMTRKIKVVVIPVMFAVEAVIPMWDVVMNSLAMEKVCATAGLHVYKKVLVDGYLGAGPNEIEKYGYRYVEAREPGGKVIVYFERQQDGSIKRTVRDQPTAEYEVVREYRSPVPELGVRSMQRWHVRHRATGEVIGEWLAFSPMHGWVDRYLLNRWFGVGLPGCDGNVLAMKTHWTQQILQPR